MDLFRSKVIRCALVMLLIGIGCGRPWGSRIDSTKKHYTPAEVRTALLPLFADYHYDRSANNWGPPNYRVVQPIPKEVAALPLFANLGKNQEVVMGALEDDTNALIVWTGSFTEKWGIVIHRSEKVRELPLINGQHFTLWNDGVFFYVGSTLPD
jgi:hypothetical protein